MIQTITIAILMIAIATVGVIASVSIAKIFTSTAYAQAQPPVLIGVNPSTKMVYVVNPLTNIVTVINGKTMVATIPLDIPPGGPVVMLVVPSTNMVYVGQTAPQPPRLVVIDGATNKITPIPIR